MYIPFIILIVICISVSGCSDSSVAPVQAAHPWPMVPGTTWTYELESNPTQELVVTVGEKISKHGNEYTVLTFSRPVAGFRSEDTLRVAGRKILTRREGRDLVWVDWTQVDSIRSVYFYRPSSCAVQCSDQVYHADAYMTYNLDVETPMVDVDLKSDLGPVRFSYNNRVWLLRSKQTGTR